QVAGDAGGDPRDHPVLDRAVELLRGVVCGLRTGSGCVHASSLVPRAQPGYREAPPGDPEVHPQGSGIARIAGRVPAARWWWGGGETPAWAHPRPAGRPGLVPASGWLAAAGPALAGPPSPLAAWPAPVGPGTARPRATAAGAGRPPGRRDSGRP